MTKSSRREKNNNGDDDDYDIDTDNIKNEFSKIQDKESVRIWRKYIQAVNNYRSTHTKNEIVKDKLGLSLSTIDKIRRKYGLKSPYRDGLGKRKKIKKDEDTEDSKDDE